MTFDLIAHTSLPLVDIRTMAVKEINNLFVCFPPRTRESCQVQRESRSPHQDNRLNLVDLWYVNVTASYKGRVESNWQ